MDTDRTPTSGERWEGDDRPLEQLTPRERYLALEESNRMWHARIKARIERARKAAGLPA